jgi:hypothetical protein
MRGKMTLKVIANYGPFSTEGDKESRFDVE